MGRRKSKAAELPPAFYLVVVLLAPIFALGDTIGDSGMVLFFVTLAILGFLGKALLDKAATLQARPNTQEQIFNPVMKKVPHPEHDVQLVVDWPATFLVIDQAVNSGAYDFARTWLQKFSYTTVGEETPQEVRDSFKRLMTAFAKVDPWYTEISPEIIAQVAVNPGVIQTSMYTLFPQHSQEKLRYIIYFAEALGQIRRIKKGRSYRLFNAVGVPGNISEPEISNEEAIARHPLFSRLSEVDIESKFRTKNLDIRTIKGISSFFCSQKEAFLNHVGSHSRGRARRPYLLFDAIDDDRSCEFCKRLDGKFMRIDDNGDFLSRYPPFALGCRTVVISLSERQWLERGGTDDSEYISGLKLPTKCPCGSWLEHHDWR